MKPTISTPIDVYAYGLGDYDAPEVARITFTESTLARVQELRTLVAQQGLDYVAVPVLPDLKVEWLIGGAGDDGKMHAWADHDNLNPSPEPVLVGPDHVTYAERAFGVGTRIVCNLEDAFCGAPPLSQREREKQGLAKLIGSLTARGWTPFKVYDGEGMEVVKGKTTAEIVEVCAATEDSNLYFKDAQQSRGYLYLVWGNSPSELVCDHSLNHGFGEAVDAALREVFPGWPSCED